MVPENIERARLSGEERRMQILDTALTLFAEKGFAATRTREIAEAAGISETLIFQHFKTKDELIRESLAVLFHPHPISGEFKRGLKQARDDAEFFRIIALHIIKHNREDPRIMKLAIFSALEGGQFWELTRERDDAPGMLDLIVDYLKKRINQGAFVKTNAGLAARLFIGAVFMYVTDQVAEISGPRISFTDDDVVETLVNIFLQGIVKK
jgi:TetR/AcrR family transcriptional regulator